ncbi:MAG: hypothetical protein KF708_18770 [Pirellulales bacterium]|nr:hypothetical protein [Pirellulales bacterium]
MVSLHSKKLTETQVEELLAELTDAAYRVALRHQSRGTFFSDDPADHEGFINVELDLWTALRAVLERDPTSEEAA